MKRIIEIEFYENYEKVIFYTIRFENDSSEMEKFLDQFDTEELRDEMDILLADLAKIGENGAEIRRFRYEGKMSDNLYAIPLVSCKLRLFCLRISNDLVILGNGFRKKDGPYELDLQANYHASILQKIDKSLKSKINNGTVYIYQREFYGSTKFTIEDEKL